MVEGMSKFSKRSHTLSRSSRISRSLVALIRGTLVEV
jgi:hypothetical protein